MIPKVLATDLDGTFIPLDGDAQNVADLRIIEAELNRCQVKLLYVTGRHLASVLHAMEVAQLPDPDFIIGDVGSSIYVKADEVQALASKSKEQNQYRLLVEYAEYLAGIVGECTVERLHECLSETGGLRKQEPEKQARFKLSYYTPPERLRAAEEQVVERLHREQLPYSTIASIDPFTGDGLLDLLPRHVSKSFALQWWADQQDFDQQEILYAGDSGNDSAAFAGGFRSIVVANAAEEVLRDARRAHAENGWSDRLFAAPSRATSGVLDGLQYFLRQAQT